MWYRLRKTLRLLIGGILVLGLLLVVIWYFRVGLFGNALKARIAEELHATLGGRYQIDGVGGTWLSDFKVHGLRMTEAPLAGGLEELSAQEVTVSFGLTRLLGGDGLDALDAIRVDRLQVQLNVADPLPATGGSSAGPPDLEAAAAWAGRLDVTGDVRLRTEAGLLRLDGVRVAARDGSLQLDVADAQMPGRFDVRGPIAGAVTPVAPGAWRWTSASSLGGVRVPTFSFNTSGGMQGRVELEAGSVEIVGREGELRVTTRSFDVARLPGWWQELASTYPWMPTAGLLDLQLVAPLAAWSTPILDLEAKALRWSNGTPLDLSGRGQFLGTGRVSLQALGARAQGVEVRVEHALLDSRLPYVLQQADIIAVEIEHIEKVWPALQRSGSLHLRAHARKGQPLQVDTARYVDGTSRLEAHGTIRPAAKPEAWRTSRVDGEVTCQLADARSLHEHLSGRATLRAALTGTLGRVTLDLEGESTDAAVAGVAVRTLQARLRVGWREVIVEEAVIAGTAGRAEVRGLLELVPSLRADLRYDASLSDVSALQRQLGLAAPLLRGTVQLGGVLRSSEAGWTATSTLEGEDLAAGDHVLGRVQARAQLRADGTLQIDHLSTRGPLGSLTGSGALDLPARQARITHLLWVEGDRRVQSVPEAPISFRWDQETLHLPDLRLRVNEASVHAQLELDLGGAGAHVESLSLRTGDHELRLTQPLHIRRAGSLVHLPRLDLEIDGETQVHTALAYDLDKQRADIRILRVQQGPQVAQLLRPLSITLHGERIDVDDVDLRVGTETRVQAALSVFPAEERVRLTRVHVDWRQRHAQLSAPATLRWDEHAVTLDELAVDVLGGHIRGRLAWTGELRGRLEATQLALEDLGGPAEGHVNATLALNAAGTRLLASSPDIQGSARSALMPRGPLSVELLQRPGEALRVEHFRWGREESLQVRGGGVLPFAVTGAGRVVQRPEDGQLELDLTAPHWPGAPEAAIGSLQAHLTADAQGVRGRVEARDLLWGDKTSTRDDAELLLHITPSMAEASVRMVGTQSTQVTGQVALDRGLDWRRPDSWQALLDRAKITGSLDLAVADWRAVQQLVPGLRTVAGSARVQVRVQGPLRTPRLDTDLKLQDFRLRIKGDLPTIADVHARIHWRAGRATVERCEGTLGFAPFRLSGSVQVPFGALPTFDLALTGKNLLLSRSRHLRLRSDVDLRLTGALDALRLSGSARIVNALYSRPLQLQGDPDGDGKVQLFSLRGYPLSDMAFDVRIDSTDRLRVRNNLVSAQLGLGLTLRGTGEVPVPEGRVTFREAVVKLPLSTLHAVQGRVVFTRTSPLNPQILATARARVKSYELGVRVWGTLPQVEFSVFSRPQLSQEEAVMLLTTGTTREGLRVEGITGSSLQAVLRVFGGAALAPLGSPPDPDRLEFFDRFDVTTGRYTSRTGRSTVEAEFQVNERFFLRGERDRFDETNLGLVWRFRLR